MKCPYCHQEMEEGLIQSPHEISWLKTRSRKLLARARLHPDSVVLSRESYLRGSAVKSWICKSCQKAVIDYADPGSDLNENFFRKSKI